MKGKFSNHVRSSLVGYVALFVALSGTAWAASELSKNEVKSKHIGKGQVKKADLANDSVNSQKVADASLLGEDFAPGQLPQGPPGPAGAAGANGATRVVTRFAAFGSGGVANEATVSCNPGEVATGGGYDAAGNGAVIPLYSNPVPDDAGTVPTGWFAGIAGGMAPFNGGTYVICASP
jgi:hypothetical protein